jgi:hypothetical protein
MVGQIMHWDTLQFLKFSMAEIEYGQMNYYRFLVQGLCSLFILSSNTSDSGGILDFATHKGGFIHSPAI